MKLFIFVGPTLPLEQARAELDAVYLPPVARGDVYRVGLERPDAIGIIDGYFAHVPAVAHKEILWAMSEEIHVFGSASMGALRSAELASFGMEGVGEIFEAFQRGAIEDDDEVAVAHGPEESGYRALSEGMVNIRATLSSARAAGIISERTHVALMDAAKRVFYAERAYPPLLRQGAELGLPAEELEALRAWLPRGRVDQKRKDALAMLRTMRERARQGWEPKRVRYTFEYTDTWETLQREAERAPLTQGQETGYVSVLTEKLVREGRWSEVLRAAIARAHLLTEARRLGVKVDAAALEESRAHFRDSQRLLDEKDVKRWLREQGMEPVELERLCRDEALLRRMELLYAPDAERHVLDHLRMTAEFAALLARARPE